MDAALLLRFHERPGALERVLGAVRRKVLSVRRLSLHEPTGGTREMLLRFDATRTSAERMVAELGGLYDVLEVRPLDDREPQTREMALAHLWRRDGTAPEEAGRVVRDGPDGVVVELTGTPAELDGILERLRATGVLVAAVRTGELLVPELEGRAAGSAPDASKPRPREGASQHQGGKRT